MSINGSPVAEASKEIEAAANLWLTDRNRYKMKQHVTFTTSSTSTQTVNQDTGNIGGLLQELQPQEPQLEEQHPQEPHSQRSDEENVEEQDLLYLLGVADIECGESDADEAYDSGLEAD